MHERDLQPEHPAARTAVDQLDALLREVRERGLHVLDLVRDVVHAGAPLGEKLPDRRVVAERREQLDPALADAHRCRLDSLVVDALPVLEAAAEQPLVRGHGGVEVSDRDSDVMNTPCLHLGDATALSAILAAMRGAALVLMAGIVAGCGGGGNGNGLANKPADTVVAATLRAAKAATLVHVVGAGKDNGRPLRIDVWMGKSRGKGHLEESGVGFDLVRIGDDVYVKGGDAFLRRFAGAAGVARFHGRWLRSTTANAQFRSLAGLTDLAGFFDAVVGQHGKIVNKGETTRGGEQVVEIRDTTQGGSLFVAADGDPYPLAVAGGTNQGDIAFTDWNGDEPIAAPRSSVDFGK
jgi:hypothetical protein